jgi:hypothetical protein
MADVCLCEDPQMVIRKTYLYDVFSGLTEKKMQHPLHTYNAQISLTR